MPGDRRGRESGAEARGPAEGGVDLATAQRIVERAVRDATATEQKASAIVAEEVAKATRREGVRVAVLAVGVAVALAAVLVATFFVYRSRKAAAVLAGEAGLDGPRVPPPSGTIPSQTYSGRAIYEENRLALYVIAYEVGDKIGGCCTAFAVAPDTLATNAHCVIACRERGGTPVVVQNESGGKVRRRIVAWSRHPGYDPKSTGSDTPDVGLIRVEGRMPKTVTLASDAELYALGPGDDVFVIGFPGRVMDPLSPSATFLQGHLGRVTSLRGEPTTPDQATLLQHDAVTRGGNSGSPVFDQYGHVVAVHAAHLDDEADVAIGGKKTTVVASSPFRVGMRIDLLRGVPAP